MDEIKKTLEGEQIDNLEGTSTSGENGVQLNSSPVPTPEEIEEAKKLSVDTEKLADEESEDSVPESEVEEEVVESDAPVDTENVETSAEAVDMPSAEKLFTQSQVNDLVGKTRMETREQTYRAIYGRYGVDDEVGMDELIGNAQRYDTIRSEYDDAKKGWEATSAARDAELMEVKEHVALLESGINRSRFDDAKAIIKAKGLEVTNENIQNELATHPEWKGSTVEKKEEENPNFKPLPKNTGKPLVDEIPNTESTIKVLGNEGNAETGGMSEEEFALKNIFKL